MAPLEDYIRKRKFSETPEPAPGKRLKDTEAAKPLFCVQRHDASHLHYDLRLEVNGALASWAVPKGPTLDSGRKSLAMKVEDHPMEYAKFEGNIPQGNYGAGSVMLWDIGRYRLLDTASAQEQLDRGDFKFFLEGEKLQGAFALVRMKKGQKGNEWLLIKKPDEHAVPGWNPEDHAWSITTKRTQEQIAANDAAFAVSEIAGARKSALPRSITPMLATLADDLPMGDRWTYELKWDGVRAICFISDGKLRVESRNGKRIEAQYPELEKLPSLLAAAGAAVLDGEIVVLDEQGRARFELIQPRISTAPAKIGPLLKTNPAKLIVYDLLFLDGYDLRGVPLETRKRLLEQTVRWDDQVQLSQAFAVEPGAMLDAVRNIGGEGIVAKDRHSVYEPKRSKRWVKVKLQNQQEFVIGGFTKGEREHFGSLMLGVWEKGSLRSTGQVGTGFDSKDMKAIAAKMAPLITKTCPFSPRPNVRNVTWLKPELVCEVRFHEWTSDGMLRAPVFLGLREDKPAADVVKEAAGTVEPATPPRSRSLSHEKDVAAFNLEGSEAVAEVDGRSLKFTNLNKILYPKDGYTKRDVIRYYNDVAEWLVPHLNDRPLSLKRYPNGIGEKFFFQKNASEHFAEWLRTEPVREGHPPKTNHYVIADDRSSLLYLANLGCIDQNPWMSRIGSLDHPDYILIDLDPVDCPFDRLIEAAQIVRRVLKRVGLNGYPKTTGGDGLHVYIPIEPVYTYDQARQFAELIFRLSEQESPNLFTEPRSVGKRKKDRVYFDWLQIGKGKTIAAPYVLRAHDGAPVATPLEWGELKPGLRPADFNLSNAIERFRKVGDLFAPVLRGGQRIESALQKLQ